MLIKKNVYICTLKRYTAMHIVKNQTKSFLPFDKTEFYLPSEEDEEYQEQKRREWEIRIYAQMVYRSYYGYNCYFITLTYNNQCLPRFNVKTRKIWNVEKCCEDYVTKDIPCFSREDIRRFTRGIQQDLLRYYNVTDYDYIICSEFGSHTQRPHYHCVLMIPDCVGPISVHELIRKHWSFVYKKERVKGTKNEFRYYRKTLGYVLPRSWNGGRDENGVYHKPILIDKNNLVNAAKYVCKYCTKDLSFYNKKDVKEIKKNLELRKKWDTQYYEFKRCLPFLKVSQHFGECLCDFVMQPDCPMWAQGFKDNQSAEERAVFGIHTPLYKGQTPLPSYVLRKLFEERYLVKVEEWRDPITPDSIDYNIFDYEFKRPPIQYSKKKNIRYTFATAKTEFFRRCLPLLYDTHVSAVRDMLVDFYATKIDSKHFADWFKDNNPLGMDFDFVRSYADKSRFMAIYSVVYQNKVNPAHYRELFENPEKFENTIVSYERVETVQLVKWFEEGYRNVSRLCTENVLQEDYYTDFRRDNLHLVSPDVLVNDWMYNGEISLPFYDGGESLGFMCDTAYDCYSIIGDVVRNPLDECYPPDSEIHAILFNCFRCFRGFDDVLALIRSYTKECKHLERLARLQKMKDKEKNNAMVYDNVNLFTNQ